MQILVCEGYSPFSIRNCLKAGINSMASRTVDSIPPCNHSVVDGLAMPASLEVREVVYGFAFHPVAGRLAKLLITHYDPMDGEPAPRDLSLDQMADTVGTTRELISRTLHRFADEGLIRVNRVELAFLDRDRLESLARGD